MSTYTVRPHERHVRATTWTLQHPLISTVGALAAAVVAGVLIGVLFSMLFASTPAAQQHRAGGHALATVAAAQHAAAAATDGTILSGATIGSTRSPARGGFAVGRSAGADDGFIQIAAGTRAPARGGFPGRSLGAGHVPAGALLHSTAST